MNCLESSIMKEVYMEDIIMRQFKKMEHGFR